MQLESKLLIYQQKIIWSSKYLLKSGKNVVKKRTPAFPPPKKKWVPEWEHVLWALPIVINPFRGPNDLCICLSLPAMASPETSRELGSKLFFANSCIYLVGLCHIINQNNSKLTWMYRKTFLLYNHPAFGYDMTKSQYSRLGIDDSTSSFRCE